MSSQSRDLSGWLEIELEAAKRDVEKWKLNLARDFENSWGGVLSEKKERHAPLTRDRIAEAIKA